MKELDEILADFRYRQDKKYQSYEQGLFEAKQQIIQWALSKLPKKRNTYCAIEREDGFNNAITQAEENIRGEI